ncbi:MBL fold metallo-hydrolase [Microbulbifer yueqingensis]|uniref:Glyoxylase, beta-lactamase superfamily II n=1 Tax=Microbulbifer yueqingensis TaxID=658219 RepID=A0A1G8XN15_9GAMM|nr:MBL fold metallo-hydrolase [Microbulbifer yueqingensis]SDJ91883.1 Glyoxylase, beta-lactamase superfamily II [Microbulbifer yueqingensis]
MRKVMKVAVLTTMAGAISVLASAQDRFANVEIKSQPVAGGVFMLQGAGGNIAVFSGEDGIFLVDDQYAPLTEKIRASLKEITDKPVRFVVNTHWHGDHTGGNENFGEAGALVVAHENVRKRMSAEQFMKELGRTVPASPAAALPVITFTDATTFHWNGDEVHVQHLAPAHTDGDSMVHFREANVIHTGDTFFNGSYPFIDLSSGGSVQGMVAAMDRVLALADDRTKIIPGHGALSNRAELKQQRDLLVELRDRIQVLVDKGLSREEVIAAKPTREYDAEYGQFFMKPDVWTGIVYDSLVRTQ